LTPGSGRNHAEAGKPRARLHAACTGIPSAYVGGLKNVTAFVELCANSRDARIRSSGRLVRNTG